MRGRAVSAPLSLPTAACHSLPALHGDKALKASLGNTFRLLKPHARPHLWTLVLVIFLGGLTAMGTRGVYLLLTPTWNVIFPGESSVASVPAAAEESWSAEFRRSATAFLLGTDDVASADPMQLLWRVAIVISIIAVLTALAQAIPTRNDVTGPRYESTLGTPSGDASDVIDYEPLYERIQAFLKPNDILVNDTSIGVICGNTRMNLPDGVDLEGAGSWGAIGWGTPDALGHCIAAPDRRCIVPSGEGGHQMTANDMGTFYRYGAKPIFLMFNNDGYFAERVTNRNPDEEYNDVAQWNFADIPAAMGCEDWYTAKVTTLGELDAALAKAEKAESGVYIEIIIDRWAIPKGGEFMFTGTGSLFGKEGRTWDGWMKEMAAKKK